MTDQQKFDCCLIGEGSLLIRCGEQLLSRGHQIQHIVTANDAVIDWAHEHHIEVVRPDDDLAAALRQPAFDYLFSIANLNIIPADVLALPRRMAINFHDGPLPRYAGLYATSWALLHQETTHGITWHVMGENVDAGAVLKQQLFDIAPDETAFTLNAKCYNAGLEAFSDLIDELAAGKVAPVAQNMAERTYFGRYRRPAAAQIVAWKRPAEEIEALVRALDFGRYANPLGLPKLLVNGEYALIARLEVLDVPSATPPGTVVEVGAQGIRIATTTRDVMIHELRTLIGQPLALADFAAASDLRAGMQLPDLADSVADELTADHQAIVRHEAFWQQRLESLETIAAPYANREMSAGIVPLTVPVSLAHLVGGGEVDDYDVLVAAFALYLARVSGSDRFDLGWRSRNRPRNFEPLYAAYVPLRVAITATASTLAALTEVLDDLAEVKKRRTYAGDMLARYPELRTLRAAGGPQYPVVVDFAASPADYALPEGAQLALLLTDEGAHLVHQGVDADPLLRGFQSFVERMGSDLTQALNTVPLLSAEELRRLFIEWNDTETPVPLHQCIHHQFEAQAALTPDVTAVVYEDQALTYAELNRRANQLARHLHGLGVRPDVPVGVYIERSLEMVVALLGILKAGGAYVPLDPAYPEERIAFMLADSGVPVLVTQDHLVSRLPEHNATIVRLDSHWPAIAAHETTNFDSGVQPENLSYIIYTSGSTGKPKGVMVEHRSVVNFFAGMDQHIDHDTPGVWLAVTSLSFDISVLELFWTLARGFKVVIYTDDLRAAGSPLAYARQPISFSLFYFASDEGEHADDKYELLIEGAKFADRHGFYAVWTPERHFHAFGGLYPNPSVASAALAVVTERVKILAGSCVLPLYSPIRVAEEWALVDNLSKGRVGISFAAGWQPNDFVLMPGNFAERKDIMLRDIDTVRRLWRGETVHLPGPQGKDVAVRTLPRPVQPELPVWLTAAGNPDTFREAGARGFNMLTHLLGQSTEELAQKIEIYRQAWREAGHPGDGHVTLMLHTFVGSDDDAVREIVRQPMKDYLRSSVDLIKKAAWSFPAFKQQTEATGQSPLEVFESADLTEADMDALLDHAFERYFRTSGLFGTEDTCLQIVDALKGIGVDEIACLIDYGVEKSAMLAQLENLNRVRERANTSPEGDYSFAAQMQRHGVTHLQCTPSLAAMLLENPANRAALGRLRQMLVGGEAFPASLANTLREIVPGDIFNMYGPTETTIWSAVHKLDGAGDSVPLGRPIANTVIYVLDSQLQPVPVGVPGELFIGGRGVVRGYHNRPELTAERFIKDPFGKAADTRLYRTGDMGRYLPDGTLEFLGRLDHQVKIRGHRIELGEIEALLDAHPTIEQSVVVAREDHNGDRRLIAYVIAAASAEVYAADVRAYLKAHLPEPMIPAQVVALDAFPLTPNNKIDRKALPAPEALAQEQSASYVPPQGDTEGRIATIWSEMLGLSQVGTEDNFFDLGGHSLLAVRMHRQICDTFSTQIPITDIFRFPTIKSLAAHLGKNHAASEAERGRSRAASRLEARQRRQERRQPRH